MTPLLFLAAPIALLLLARYLYRGLMNSCPHCGAWNSGMDADGDYTCMKCRWDFPRP